MRIEIIRTYEYEDADYSGDALQVEMFIDGKSVLCGDYYHNHIEDRIEGFLSSLDFQGVSYELIEMNVNDDANESLFG